MSATKPSLSSEETRIIDREKQCLVQSYGRYPLVIDHGKGCQVCDLNNRSYLDFVTGLGVNALGHAHPRILRVMHEQMEKLIHSSNLYYHRYQGTLAERLVEMSGLQRAFLANTGTEAVEGALKIAKGYGRKRSPNKYGIVALNGSFSGRTLGSISVTGQPKYREPFEPLIPGVTFVDANDLYGLEAAVDENTAAILFEPILGEGGLVEISRRFAERAAALARQNDALLIFDEIQCGLGRTGRYFAYQWWDETASGGAKPILPDIALVAKPLAGGLPLGAILVNEKASEVITPGLHGTTFGGGALACRVALEFLDVMEELLPHIRETGDYFRGRLGELAGKYDFIKEIRGKGLMLALNLSVPGKAVVPQAQEAGLLINCTADTVLRFLPPYIIEKQHIDELIACLDKIFEKGPPEQA
jgi:predicted acetylornithine/succinylornithine family transaminase